VSYRYSARVASRQSVRSPAFLGATSWSPATIGAVSVGLVALMVGGFYVNRAIYKGATGASSYSDPVPGNMALYGTMAVIGVGAVAGWIWQATGVTDAIRNA